MGGKEALIGTNPISCAVPGKPGKIAFLIDQPSSAVAWTAVKRAADEGRDIPLGWAIDKNGKPTTDPAQGLAGSIEQYGIPGMAVAVTIDGARYFIEYGVASKQPRVSVTRDTLFELRSVSKTFTATLASYAEVEGKLLLNDSVGTYMPELKGTALGNVRLLDLGTHTAGGFPLQLPDSVKNQKQLTAYFRAWKPRFAEGTTRIYANPSIGMLGVVTAKAMRTSFTSSAESLFRDLGLRRTYIDIPAEEMKPYAWGYKGDGKPIRVAPAMLAAEAYGVKSNAVDMIRFLEVNMSIGAVPDEVARAVNATHTGYFGAG
jgi:beta-lactamase class C